MTADKLVVTKNLNIIYQDKAGKDKMYTLFMQEFRDLQKTSQTKDFPESCNYC